MAMTNSEPNHIIEYYVPADRLTWYEKARRDSWCLHTFGEMRNGIDEDAGWWLQSEEEYSLFLLCWGDSSGQG
jgi:hypothetical protein